MLPERAEEGLSPVEESEQALVSAASRDPQAFGELYQRYLPRIYSYVYYRTGSVPDAEDLTGKVFLQALAHLPRYSDRGLPFSAWLYRIAHNLVANWFRERSRHPQVPLEAALPTVGQEMPDPVLLERQEMVRRAVRRLSPERQHLILLRFVEGMSNAEIARAMGRSEGAVKVLLYRTLRALREHLAAVEGSYEETGGRNEKAKRGR